MDKEKFSQLLAEHPAITYPRVQPAGPAIGSLLLVIILALATLGAFGAGLYYQARNVQEAGQLKRTGISTTATVVQKKTEEAEKELMYFITYAFTTEQGAFEREVGVFQPTYQAVEEGGPIEVIYAAGDPTISRIVAEYKPGSVGWAPLIFGGFSTLVLAAMTYWLYTRYHQAARLDREGVVAQVRILDTYELKDDEGTDYYVAYQVPGGGRITHTIPKRVYRRYHAGDTISLTYLPDNPTTFRPHW